MKAFDLSPASCCAHCPHRSAGCPELRVALIGQPNCGKSTLFNSVAGYRSATGNFPGTTVRLEWSTVRVNGHLIELVDLPGVYSLTSSNPTESAAREFLLGGETDVILNVLDAALLPRSLELTLELRELEIPMVVCLNMMDEASRKGIEISPQVLAGEIGLPVVSAVAYRGEGVRETFAAVIAQLGRAPQPVESLRWHSDVERVVSRMELCLRNGHPSPPMREGKIRPAFPPQRFRAVKLLEGDSEFLSHAGDAARAAAGKLRQELEQSHGRPAESVLMSERHDRAMALCENTTTVGHAQPDFRHAVDAFLTHPVWGYAALLGVLGAFFWTVFGIGSALENSLLSWLGTAWSFYASGYADGSLGLVVARSAWDGFMGGAAIVLPYLVPFLIGLALLEDAGYLPRVAYLLDGLLHRIGLHGTSVVPLMLGYGCSVPACLATRILPSRRDRFLATVLATLVPCSARSTVIFALAAAYLGPAWALGIFAFNALVVFFSGWLLARMWPEISAGMILEVPRYQWPSARIVARKVWLRLREFVVVSWPLLVLGSVILGLAEFLRWERYVNSALSPLTSLLGLPEAVGLTLIFGVLRKELSLVMLTQALGTMDVASVMTAAQILVFTLFITFYIPCLATLVAMTKEIGRRLTLLAMAYSLLLATALGALARFLLGALHMKGM